MGETEFVCARGAEPIVDRRRLTAIHEAGHAVMAIRQRLTFRSVSIVENDHSKGRVLGLPVAAWFQPGAYTDSRVRSTIEEDITVFLAGPLAEARFRGATVSDVLEEPALVGAACDVQAVVELAEYASGSDAEADAFIQWLTHHTWNWVHDDLCGGARSSVLPTSC